MLEPSKGQSALIEVFVGIRSVQTETANEIIHSPELAIAVAIAVLTPQGGNKVQDHPGVIYLLPDVIGDRAGIDHDLHRVFKHILVNSLQNVFPAGICTDLIGMVNMSMSKIQARDGMAVESECIGRFFYVH